ncbi:MAG: PLP-dependent transferase, partial [Alphaproteobacteria bacterium]|nr:PLP-dependent transferase [Alphaproteobacteria bacterium]
IKPNTKVVFTESPGSLTFEVQDIPAIAKAAHAAGALVVLDNTWATPLFFRPFEHGVDLSLQAVTKYINGHSDVIMGVVTGSKALVKRLRRTNNLDGGHVNPQDCYLALRGLRSMAARLARHQETALRLASWLEARPEVVRMLHPAFASCPGHELWKRDFTGSSSLFSFLMKPVPRPALAAMVEGMRIFRMGFSWGGYESLMLPVDKTLTRTAVPWAQEGVLVRIHAGLEDAGDLIADLDAGFARIK